MSPDESVTPGNHRNGGDASNGGKGPGADLFDYNPFGDWTAWGQVLVLLVLLPVSLLCLLPFVALVAAILPGNLVTWYVIYFAPLLLMFIPGMLWLQVRICAPNSRRPTREESARIDPAWDAVYSRLGAKRRRRRYRFQVLDIDEVNAAAAGGNVIIVTRWALHVLSDRQLKAVLAHELGHQAGLHSVVLAIKAWVLRPIFWADWLAGKLHDLSAWATGLQMRNAAFIALWVAALVFRTLSFLLQLIVRLATLISLAFGRAAEYKADAFAGNLGLAPDLISALLVMEGVDESYLSDADARFNSINDTHPPTAKRIERLRRVAGMQGPN